MKTGPQMMREYVRERDAMLLTGDIAALKAFMRKHSMRLPSCDEVAEIMLHKTITAARTLPIDYRRQSKQWLTLRGYQPWDDGDL